MRLPYDILALIVDAIWTRTDPTPSGQRDVATLKALSQTCKLMLPLCRKCLFAAVQFSSRSGVRTKEFMDLLRESPTIARYVKVLHYTIREPADEHIYEYGILDTLHRYSSSLFAMLIAPDSYDSSDEPLAWNVQPEYIQALLISLMQLPTVTQLSLSTLHGFPAEQLLLCRGVKNLDLDHMPSFALPAIAGPGPITVQAPAPEYLSVSLKSWAALAAIMDPTRRPNSLGPILDLSRVQHACVTVGENVEVEVLCEFLKAATQLELLTIEGEYTQKL